MKKYINLSPKGILKYMLALLVAGSTAVYGQQNICIPFAGSASADQNYISTKTFKVPGVTENTLNAPRNTCEVNQVVQYFDGLGRPSQTVTVQGSPGFRDLVQPNAYDAFGREQYQYLPYVSAPGNGNFKPAALSGQHLFYSNPAAYSAPGVTPIPGTAFSETRFEASPLNRVLEQGSAGASWQLNAGHTRITAYSFNNSSTAYSSTGYAVRLYRALTVNNPGEEHKRILSGTGYYLANELSLTISKDENWTSADGKAGTVEEYKDKLGKVVLKRFFNQKNGTIETLSTYYVYDDFGNLSFVLPPGADPDSQTVPNQGVLDNYGYQYRYDGKNRLIEKKLPGKGWEYMVYNELDQLVLSQDAVQRGNHQWLFTKYDALGRVVINGLYIDAADRSALETLLNAQQILWEDRSAAGIGYTNNSFPQAIAYYHSIDYYDDYNFPGNGFGQPNGSTQVLPPRTKGLQTGSSVTVLGTGTMLLTVNYYDKEGRVVQSKSQNHLGGTDVTDNTWSFSGELTTSTRSHTSSAGGQVTVIANRYAYDHMGRKLATMASINGATEVVLSKQSYNEVGQLLKKELHSTDNGSSFLQNTQYSYNERGWLKNSTSGQFSLQLNYNDAIGSLPQYNGNISNQLWGFGPATSGTFSYAYDKLNRLTSAVSPGLGENIGYDVMGNITTLTREGKGTNQYLNYTGNRLGGISGFTNSSYGYDANGNLISDSGKGIVLNYNYLNLPSQVTGSQTLTYTYDAKGNKLRKQSNTAGTTNYVNGIQYKPDGSIDVILTEEGLARNNPGGSYSYEYNLTDHLGNVRYTFNRNPLTGQLEKLQSDDYFAFGLRKVVDAGTNKYLYNGKELQEELGEYDYGARFYDPIVGRWNAVDPLAEKSRRFSPYVYANNNPVRFIDPDGMEAEDPQKRVNTTVTSTEDKNHKLHVTQSTTTTTVVKTETGSVTTKTVMSSTNVISNSSTEGTVYGAVTTKTSVTTVDGDKTTTVNGEPSTVNRADSKADLSALNGVSKSLENFRNEHGMQFNSYVNKEGTSALSLSVGGAAAPFGALTSLSTLASNIGGWAPSLVRALGFGGAPTSIGPGLASKAITASGVLNGPKTIFVSSNGRVISNMLPKR